MRYVLTVMLTIVVAGCSGKQATEDRPPGDGEYADAMQKEHGSETPTASGAGGQAEGEFEVKGRLVEYGSVDGKAVSGYIAGPVSEEPPKAGLILIHEWWGLNDNIKEMARKFASHGYIVLAVDMYGGEFASKPEDAKALMMEAMEKPELGVENLKAARMALATEGAEKIGVLGWCFGGGWALRAGITQADELDAVVMYYGRVLTEPSEIKPLTAPLLGIFAAKDQGIPVDQVKLFDAALESAGEDAEIHIYDGVDHAFANPSGERYNAEAANDAWAKVIAFLAEHLQS